jgi:hypothetical protein
LAEHRGGDGRPVHSMRRVLGRLTVGTVKERERQVYAKDAGRLHEVLFEFQVAIAGTANARVAWQSAGCGFPAPMVEAPLQRDSGLEVPQFFFGYHLHNATAPVVVVAHVSGWAYDDSDYIVGASCQIGAYTPAENNDVEFAGFAHLTFQGYAGAELGNEEA